MKDWIRALIIILLTAAVFLTGMIYEESITTDNNDICKEAGIELNEKEILAGFYDYDGYYCVRTDINWERTVTTETHESCHALIHKNKDHFCGGTKQ